MLFSAADAANVPGDRMSKTKKGAVTRAAAEVSARKEDLLMQTEELRRVPVPG